MRKVTIGIPAYNEEQNILNMLRAIEGQACGIAEVIISDDSTDGTPGVVANFIKNSSLNVVHIHHSVRRGAAAAWNEIFEKATGDSIVLYDADTIPHPDCTRRLVAGLSYKNGLCASNSQPVQAAGLAGRASSFISSWLRSMRQAGLSKYTVMGRGLSIDSGAAKKITIPQNVIAIDLYLQCAVLEMGLDVVYDDGAVVYFRPAASLQDLASQVLRAASGHGQIKEYVSKLGMGLPLSVAISRTARAIASDPLGAASVAIGYSPLPYYRAKLGGRTRSALWHTAASSKSIDPDKLRAAK